MKTLAVLFALPLFPLLSVSNAGEVVKRDVRYKKDGPVVSQYVFQAGGTRRTSSSSRSRSYRPATYSYGSSCYYPRSSFRSYYPAIRTTRVTFIHRPVVIHHSGRHAHSFRSLRPAVIRKR